MAVASITTEIQIANLALARLGQTKTVSNIDAPTTPSEVLVALHFAMTRESLFRNFVFNFTKKYAQPAEDVGETPAFGFARAYTLPADFIKVLAIGDVTINNDHDHGAFDVMEGHIYTNEEDATGVLNLYYIYNNKTVTEWDKLFIKLMYLQLAADMSYAFTIKPSLWDRIEKDLADVKLQAAAAAGQEKRPRRIQRSNIVSVRKFGRHGRDTTRYPV